jgi:hypothetical protein
LNFPTHSMYFFEQNSIPQSIEGLKHMLNKTARFYIENPLD